MIPSVRASFASRLDRAMTIRSMSNGQLEKLAALSKGAAGRYRKGLRGENATFAVVTRIANALRVRAEWLAEGTGEMFLADDTPITDPQPNRVPLYDSDEYKNADPKVQLWFNSRRAAEDLTTDQWRQALAAAATLFGLGLLDTRARTGVARKKGD